MDGMSTDQNQNLWHKTRPRLGLRGGGVLKAAVPAFVVTPQMDTVCMAQIEGNGHGKRVRVTFEALGTFDDDA